jgi:hypothetical protein
MIRRIGRPGLLGTMARTAVIAGTATAVVGGMQSRQQARAAAANQQQVEQQQSMEQQAQIDAMQEQMAGAPTAPSAPAQDDTLTKLAKLGQMKEAGLIDDAEFTAAKAQVLGI